MLHRLALRATFWATLTVMSLFTGLSAIGAAPLAPRSIVAFGAFLLPFVKGAAPLAAYSGVASLATLVAATGGWLLARRELTRRSASDGVLRERETRLHAAMHGSVDGMFLLQAIRDHAQNVVDFEVVDVNACGASLLRETRERLVGRRASEMSPLKCHKRLFADYVSAVHSGAPLISEVKVSLRQFATEWLWHQAVPVGDGLAITIRDIAGIKLEEERLRHASLTDELTQLYNRRGFVTLAEQQLKVARRQGRDLVLFFADMDKFKSVNDRFGHAEGDRSLRAVGALLRGAVRESDIVARLGGDEFTVLAVDGDASTASAILRRINERVAAVNARGELAAPLSMSIGHVRIKACDAQSLDELLAHADQLLYERKSQRPRTRAPRRQPMPEGVTIAA